MRRFAMIGLLSCVPAGGSVDTRGAVAIVTSPSAETRGAAFTSDDGWTVQIRQIAFVSVLAARTPELEEPAEEHFLWDPAVPQSLVVRAVPTGKRDVFLALLPPGKRIDQNGQESTAYLNQGVPADLEASFKSAGPACVRARVHADKGDQQLDVEIPLLVPTRPEDQSSSNYEVTVTTDTATELRITVHAEVLFKSFQSLVDHTSDSRPPLISADGVFVVQ